MDDLVSGFLRSAKAVAAAAKAVDAAAKAGERKPRSAALVADAATKAAKALAEVAGTDAGADALRAAMQREADAAGAELERERAVLAGTVAKALQAGGLAVDGNLPLLRAGALTIEFAFGARGQCTLWFGPKKARLATCALDADAIASKAIELDAALFRRDLDEAAFLAELERAWRVALVRRGEEGQRVPLVALLAEVALGRQDAAFMSDPRRELFASYGRVEFAADLSRLRTRRHGDRELRLEVATLAQTRKPEDHLFVPHGRSVDGTCYATAAFVPWRAQ